MGYLLTDQAYAVSITRWTQDDDAAASGGPPAPGLDHKVPYYLGAALLLWVNWQICTIIGVLIGSRGAGVAAPRLRRAARVPGAPRARHQLPARRGRRARRWSRGAVRATREARATSRCSSVRSAGIAAGAFAEAMIDRRGPRDDDAAAARPRCRAVSRVWMAIVLSGIGTYAMRASFLVFAHRLADVPPAHPAAAAPDPAGRAGGHRRTRLPPPRGSDRPLAAPVPRRCRGRLHRLADQEHRPHAGRGHRARHGDRRPLNRPGFRVPSAHDHDRRPHRRPARSRLVGRPRAGARLLHLGPSRGAGLPRRSQRLVGRHPPRRPASTSSDGATSSPPGAPTGRTSGWTSRT